MNDTCPTCRHQEHEGSVCLNMASDNDCSCIGPEAPAITVTWDLPPEAERNQLIARIHKLEAENAALRRGRA